MEPSPLLSVDQETKLVEYACNRASLGTGFGKTQFMSYSVQYAKKQSLKFKNSTPSDKWWQGIRRRNASLPLRKPEATSSVRHQCMEPLKV